MKSKLIILAIVIIVLGGGWYYYKNYSTLGWKTYTNNVVGYEIKMPQNHNPYTDEWMDNGTDDRKMVIADNKAPNVFLAEIDEHFFCCETNSIDISVDPRKIGDAIDGYKNLFKYDPYLTTKETVFSGKEAVEILGSGGKETVHRLVAVAMPNGTLIIRQTYPSKYLDRVLSTFRFIE